MFQFLLTLGGHAEKQCFSRSTELPCNPQSNLTVSSSNGSHYKGKDVKVSVRHHDQAMRRPASANILFT
eukprot:10962552-Karenia_brevis.AAC.1